MEKKFNYVYITTNLINGKQYIGDHSTDNLNDKYLGSGRIFRRVVKKYGSSNFLRTILEHCDTKQDAFKLQKKYIDENNTLYPNGYNLSPTGGSGCPGSMSEYQKQRIREANTGKIFSHEHRRKLKESHIGQIPYNKGVSWSAETKEKISKSNKGRVQSKEERKMRSECSAHRPISDWEKLNLKDKLTGIKRSKETKERLCDSHLGISPGNKGKMAIYKNEERTYIQKDQLDKYLENGWSTKNPYKRKFPTNKQQ